MYARTEATRDLTELLTAKTEGGMKCVNLGPKLHAAKVDEEIKTMARDVLVRKPAKKLFEAELMEIPHNPLWPTKTRIPPILQHIQCCIEEAEHTVEVADPDSEALDVSNDDPGGGKYIHVAKGDTSHSEVPPPEVGMIVTENFPPDNTKGEEEQDIVKDVPQVQLDLGEVSPLSCDQEHLGVTGSNVQTKVEAKWVRNLNFNFKNSDSRKPTQDDRPHL